MNFVLGFAIFVAYILFIIALMSCFILSSEIAREEEAMEKIRVKSENNNKDINNIKNN